MENKAITGHLSVSTASQGAAAANSSAMPKESLRVISQITNSDRLSIGEKNALIRSIAVIDRYASQNEALRDALLNDVVRSTVFLENNSEQAITANPSLQVSIARYQSVQAERREVSEQRVEALVNRTLAQLEERVSGQNDASTADVAAFGSSSETPEITLNLPGSGFEPLQSYPLPGAAIADTAALIEANSELALAAVPEVYIPGSMLYEDKEAPLRARISLTI